MNYYNRQIILFAALVCSFIKTFAQNTEVADNLFGEGNYMAAAVEYEQVFFNWQDVPGKSSEKNTLLLKKSLCYKMTGEYDKEILNLQRLNPDLLTDSLKFVYRYETLLAHYLYDDSKNETSSSTELMNIIADSVFAKKARYLCVLTLVKMYLFEEAKKEFALMVQENNLPKDSLLKFDALCKLNLKSEKKAKVLSFIFPGAGQMYAGKVFPGILSTLLVGAFGTYTVFAVIHQLYVSAFFTGFSFSTRFYFGGMKYAVKTVKDKNLKKTRAAKQKTEQLVLNCVLLK